MRRLAAALLCALAGAPAQAAVPRTPADLFRDHLWQELRSLPAEKRPRVGLVLSAGSLRATAHVGVLSILEREAFPIDVVAGTSMGAIIGSLYAGGTSSKRMRELSRTISLGSGSNYSSASLLTLVLFDNLLSSARTEAFLRREIGARRFEELPKPFACVAMDINSGEPILFREGDLAPAVRASMSLPGLFTPVEYRHRYLVDGGVVDYIPVDAARLLGAEWVLASVTEGDYTHTKPRNVLQNLEQVIDIRGSFLSREQRRQANFLIEPPVGDIELGDKGRIQEAIEKGALEANKRIPAAMESLILFSLPRTAR